MATQQRIVTQDIRDIPAHCVPLSSFGGRRNKRGGSWEYETLHALCKRREIKHWKFERGRTGQLFVEPETAKELLGALRQHKINATTLQTHAPAANDAAMSLMEMRLTFSRVEAVLERVASILERVAVAAEAIATQPLDTAGSWRGMNGETN